MKRKLTALLTALMLLALMVTPAFADLIWEPYGNSFYESHRDECEYWDYSYLANDDKGYVTVRSAPGSAGEVVNIPNGTYFYASHVWKEKDGSNWLVGYPSGMFDAQGWVRMDEMARIYDYRDFEEDHGAEFRQYDGSGDHLKEAYVYAYPGGVCGSKMEHGGGDYSFTEGFRNLYTDENGLRWTFIGYYMGHWDGWVCIDDPLNENLGTETQLTVLQVRWGGSLNPPAENADSSGTRSPEPEQSTGVIYPPAEDIPPARTFPLWAIPVVLIVVVALVTAVIVRKRRK